MNITNPDAALPWVVLSVIEQLVDVQVGPANQMVEAKPNLPDRSLQPQQSVLLSMSSCIKYKM